MKIKWIVAPGEKTWVESNEDINILPIRLPNMKEDEYMVGGSICNPQRIRKQTEFGLMRPADIEQSGKSFIVSKWEKAY